MMESKGFLLFLALFLTQELLAAEPSQKAKDQENILQKRLREAVKKKNYAEILGSLKEGAVPKLQDLHDDARLFSLNELSDFPTQKLYLGIVVGNLQWVEEALKEEAQVHQRFGNDSYDGPVNNNFLHVFFGLFNQNLNPEILKLLLAEGVNPVEKNCFYETPLHHAIWNGRAKKDSVLECIEMIIEAGTDMSFVKWCNFSPAAYGYEEVFAPYR